MRRGGLVAVRWISYATSGQCKAAGVCALGCLRVKGDIEVRSVETERAARRAAAPVTCKGRGPAKTP